MFCTWCTELIYSYTDSYTENCGISIASVVKVHQHFTEPSILISWKVHATAKWRKLHWKSFLLWHKLYRCLPFSGPASPQRLNRMKIGPWTSLHSNKVSTEFILNIVILLLPKWKYITKTHIQFWTTTIFCCNTGWSFWMMPWGPQRWYQWVSARKM